MSRGGGAWSVSSPRTRTRLGAAMAALVVAGVCATTVSPLSVRSGGWAVDTPAATTAVWPDGLRETVGADQEAGAYGVVAGADGTAVIASGSAYVYVRSTAP